MTDALEIRLRIEDGNLVVSLYQGTDQGAYLISEDFISTEQLVRALAKETKP